ncbi:MAG: hypothetical protein Alpg2KO_26390 [Alphaproteobacteria bacterium]
MHILLGVLGLILAIGIWIWRIQRAAEGLKAGAQGVRDVQSGIRRFFWRRKLSTDLLADEQDPRIAAAAMMVSLAQSRSTLSEAEERAILSGMQKTFRTPEKELSEILSQARWLTRDASDLPTTFNRVRNLMMNRLSPTERAELVALLKDVAHAGDQSDLPFAEAEIRKVAIWMQVE